MPRYLIVRTFEIDEEAMPDLGRRSKEIGSSVTRSRSNLFPPHLVSRPLS
jgi:hypothetical protein